MAAEIDAHYQESLQKLQNYKTLPTKGVYMDGFFNSPRLYLDRTKELLNRCGFIGNELPIIHVAGTSGKGTLAATIAAAIEKSGQKVGLFSSPPVQVETERFVVNGVLIAAEEYLERLEKILVVAQSMADTALGRPSVGEIHTVLAYRYFLDSGCDIAIIEALAGGQFDATNALENKLATAITRIGLDHMHILGDTTEKIAIDKAHIARPGTPLFCGEEDHALQNLIQAVCENIGADFRAVPFNDGYDVSIMAQQILDFLGIVYDLAVAKLPARYEQFDLYGANIIIDGAHNRQKVNYLLGLIQKDFPDKKINLVLATSNNRNSKDYVIDLMSAAHNINITTFYLDEERKHSPKLAMRTVDELSAMADEIGKNYQIWDDPIAALIELTKEISSDEIILVTGSMFLAGKVRELFYPNYAILEQRTLFPV